MCSKTQGKKEKADRQPALSKFKSCLLTYAVGLNKGVYIMLCDIIHVTLWQIWPQAIYGRHSPEQFCKLKIFWSCWTIAINMRKHPLLLPFPSLLVIHTMSHAKIVLG